MVQLSHPHMTTGQMTALARWSFVDKVMSLLFNTLYKFVIYFLPKSKQHLVSWLKSPSAVILEPKKIKSLTFSIVSPSICHEVMVPDAMIFIFQLHQESLQFLFAFCCKSGIIRYLRLLIFLTAILIPACASSILAFCMMYSAYKWNKQGDNVQPWHTPFPIWSQPICSMSSSNCCFLTCIQISQMAGKVVWYSHLFQNFPQFLVIHTVKGFGIVNNAEIYVFLELSCFFDDAMDVGNSISGSSAFPKSSLNIWKFWVHIPLKPGLEGFEHYFASMWDEWNFAVLFAITILIVLNCALYFTPHLI